MRLVVNNGDLIDVNGTPLPSLTLQERLTAMCDVGLHPFGLDPNDMDLCGRCRACGYELRWSDRPSPPLKDHP